MQEPYAVTFLPMRVTCAASHGDTLLDVALAHGLSLPHACGGNCFCTTCHVRVIDGGERLSPMEEPERERLEDYPDRGPDSRLACQALVLGGPIAVLLADDPAQGTRSADNG